MIENEFLTALNPSQRDAVEYCDGPELVIAGAGSGKTRVLTYKIAYLLSQGYQPWSILALTFTNRAADEMKERIAKIVGREQASRLNMGTFHSVFSRILRIESDIIGYHSNFTIYDETDSRSLLKAIIKELGLDDKIYKPGSVHARISMAKNKLILAQQYAANRTLIERDRDARMPEISRIFSIYEQRCLQANAMDFDDLLVITYRLFAEHPDICTKYATRFQYVLVDEYQDTNYVQQCIVFQLTQANRRVCVVGDDAQSIYGFRGANIDNILEYNKIYPDSKLFKLEQNYRSTQRIVQAANSLIKHNERQIPKDVFSENDTGEKLLLKPLYSDKEEAAVVCKDIMRIRRQDRCAYSDFAILYRTNSQSRSFEEELLKYNIPYRIYGGMSFYQRKEIKDIIAYFRLIVNHDDEEAFKRIINYPTRGIGNITLQKVIAASQQSGVSLWTAITQPNACGLELSRSVFTKLEAFSQMIERFTSKLNTVDAMMLGEEIVKESGISADIYASKDTENLSKQENLTEFFNGLQEFVEGNREEGLEERVYLPDFLQTVALYQDKETEDGSKVNLMTVHAAKGLEFPTVFIVGLEENIFPSPMSTNSLRELEEERRLLYVAITRAEKRCILTCAKNRWRYGKLETDVPSRFLRDIDPRFIVIDEGMGRISEAPRRVVPQRQIEPIEKPRSAYTPSFRPVRTVQQPVEHTQPMAHNLQVGSRIEHQRFGVGVVQKIEGEGENTKATVEFANTGTKLLLLKFARYKVL
ncbi:MULTISPECIES: ATP-dependent helicase [unclassified Prevotella]|uniref:ATP-dependent helicase n=1 Tax=unclassified Prevotella TaxID=2638335 RepID=UPI000514843B|nr:MULTISPECIES: UvrD-helicase domain-containing protein [unclassified Prevotella]KGI60540.1 ATP-dependent DNA helicase [Prevotella sp. S7 MS 2]